VIATRNRQRAKSSTITVSARRIAAQRRHKDQDRRHDPRRLPRQLGLDNRYCSTGIGSRAAFQNRPSSSTTDTDNAAEP